jgi:hypothetical protein
MTEYSLDIYSAETDKFVSQVDVFSTYEEAEQCKANNELAAGYEYNITAIEYGEDGDEIRTYTL